MTDIQKIYSLKDTWANYIHELQNQICQALEIEDGKAVFISDKWDRSGGGGGDTRHITNGNEIEKGGVNTFVLFGDVTDAMRRQLKIDGHAWFACGLSLVIHPLNPYV